MEDQLQLKEPNINFDSFTRYVKESRYEMVPDNTPKSALEFLAISNALAGEAGELANVCKKIVKAGVFYKDSDLHDKFVLEAGDALHYLLSLIDLAGFRVQHIMACNVMKLDERKRLHEAAETATVFATSTLEPRVGEGRT